MDNPLGNVYSLHNLVHSNEAYTEVQKMGTIWHQTGLHEAKSILLNQKIYGCASDSSLHEAYPHFYHDDYVKPRPVPCHLNCLPVHAEINLIFTYSNELIRRNVEDSPPKVGNINFHFGDKFHTRFWQCTLHPDSRNCLILVDFQILDDFDLRDDVELCYLLDTRLGREFSVIWNPKSANARDVRQKSLRRKMHLHERIAAYSRRMRGAAIWLSQRRK